MKIGKYNPWMRDDQIVASWRDAADRRVQVKILAQLNAVPRSVIEEILIAHGCDIGKKKRPPERAEEKKPWREQDDERLMALHGEGRSYKEIAETLDRTVAAVKQRIINLNRKERDKEMNGRGWTSDEVAFMLERRKQGVDVRHIAAEMGRTTVAITSKLKKLREKGKKIAEEIKTEEEAKGTVEGSPQDEAMIKAAAIADRVIRIAEDYKAAAVMMGEAPDVRIDASETSATLFAKTGRTVILLKETAKK